MNAKFERQGGNSPAVRLEPVGEVEELLLEAFLRYDANVFHVVVDRDRAGRIRNVRIVADQS